MESIAILLHGSIKSDYRVIKTIRTLSSKFEIVLYFLGNQEDVLAHFDDFQNIECYAIQPKNGIKQKILKHSLICYEFDYFVTEILRSGKKFDFIWANDLPMLHPSLLIAKKQNAKLIYDSHEIFVETLNQFFIKGQNVIKNQIFTFLIKLMRWHGRRLEAKMLKSTDLMFTVNESLKSYFIDKYQYKNIEVMMNLPYKSKDVSQNKFDFIAHFNWPSDSFVVLYQGALNSGRGLELMIDAFQHLDPPYRLVIMGDGILAKSLKAQTKSLGIENRVGFYNAVPLSELPFYTRGANIGLNLLETFNLSKQLASPNKLFEYIHAGIPVVASNTIENQKVFDLYEIGETCINNPNDVAEKIKLTHSRISNYSPSLEKAKLHFNWESQESRIIDVIERLTKK